MLLEPNTEGRWGH